MTKSKMAVLSGTFARSQTKDKYILISLMFVSHLVFALDASLADQKVDLLDRHRRAVTTYSVTLPSAVPENVSSSSVLYNLTILYPSRSYVVTNNSAGAQGLFQIAGGILTLMPSLTAEIRNVFDYEKFHTIQVMINATNQTDPSDVVMLTVTIPLSDVNDEPPVITNKPKPLLATLPVNPQPGRVVFTVTATDPDSTSDLIFSIDLVTSSDSANTQRFQYQANSGGNIGEKLFNIVISGAGALQSGAEYTIKFSVTDRYTVSGSPQTTDTLVVRVGNRAPQFYETSYKGRIYENMTPATTNWVLEADSNNKLGIQVKQFQAGNALTFQLLLANGQPSQMFNIHAEDGVQRIVNKISIDYEVTKYESLFIQVREAGTGLTSSVAITINIIDEKVNSPAFCSAQYSTTISENAAIGSTVLMVTASDVDSGLNGEIVFSIVNSTYFGVTTAPGNNAYIGTVTVKSRLDYDSGESHIQFFVIASDKGTPVRLTQVPVFVTLQNVNDNPPTIVNTTSTIILTETTPLQSVVTIFQASDIDGDAVKFYFEGRIPTYEIFTIRDTNGQMTLTSPIPKNKDSYILKVIAVDDDSCCASKNGYLTATATFTVNIIDINVNKPFFNSCLVYDTTASIKEGSPVGTTVIQVSASDPDRGDNGKVIYRIEPADPNAPFQIDPNSGNITVKGNIVRDQSGFVQVTVVARNPPALPLMEGRCTFRVNIIDINNNPPTFSQPVYEIPVSLSTRPPAILYQMAAQDKDVGQNANITYTLGPSDIITMMTFSINIFTGVISLDSVLDSSTLVYYLTVIANDNGKDPGPLTGTANVTIKVNTDGGKPPEWINLPANQTFSVSENALRGYVITTLACQSDSNVTGPEFRVYDAVSAITSDSKNFMAVTFVDNGVSHMNLTLRAVLNYEVQTEYKLSVVCQSVVGQVVLQAPLYTVVIKVLDANDEVPEFFGLDANGRYSASVSENSPPLTSFLQVTANDRDTNPPFNVITFTLEGPNKDLFQVNNLGGNRADILTGSGLNLDREVTPYYALLIVARDGAPASPADLNNANLPNTALRYIDITVSDVNDNPPVFSQSLYTFNIPENVAIGDVVGIVTATDPDDVDKGLGLQYRFIDGNVNNAFNIFSVTGAIRVAKKLDYENPQEPKIYNITLMALDQNQLHSATTTIQIVLLDENDNRPVFSPLSYSVMNVVTEEDKTVTPQNPQFLVKVTATDADVYWPQTSIRYSIFGTSDVAPLFTVDPISGTVSLIGSLDRDIPPFYYTVTVEARDEVVNPLSSFADVLVYPMDINDNAPVFNVQYLQGSVPENSVNTYVMTVIAVDKDEGNNGTVNYRIDPVQPNAALSAMFTVNTTGDIYTTNNVTLLDRETIDKILLVVQAYDMGTHPYSSTATATITIL
uniref:Cadherin domain-containing protein n=1 Tax=Arion vulgaris TaxID=1028688 RepID=A0A0B7BPU3_9EUPU